MKGLVYLLLVVLPVAVTASEWDVRNIPEDLGKDALSVLRRNSTIIKVHNNRSYTIYREVVLTVLNSQADDHANLVIHYDKHSRVAFKAGAIFDKNGKRVRSISGRDLDDRSHIDGFSLFEDNRVKLFNPRMNTYPYTVSYGYEVTYSKTMFTRVFTPMNFSRQAVEQASLRFELPHDFAMNYRYFNMNPPIISEEPNGINYHWSFKDISATRNEPYSPPIQEYLPVVYYTPENFEFDNYQGSTATWEDFSRWISSLNSGKRNLPEERVAEIQKMVEGAESKRDKAELLYNYLQSRTRYVNLKLGIGGFQPIDAETVDRLGYGDCKALTNYMQSLLEAVGIESYYTLIQMGKDDYTILADLPGNQFNHVILCVPDFNDTIWLECTSQHLPFGFLGRNTHNRPALLIENDGGRIVHTPLYDISRNVRKSHIHLRLDATGNADALVGISYSGLFYGDKYGLDVLAPSDQQRWIFRNFNFPNYELNNHYIENIKSTYPVLKLNMEISLRSFARVTGNRLFIQLHTLLGTPAQPERLQQRRTNFVLHDGFSYNDTIAIQIPPGYTLEQDQLILDFQTEFGTYRTGIVLIENGILYHRSINLLAGTFKPESYNDFTEFYSRIATSDRRQLVLRKLPDD